RLRAIARLMQMPEEIQRRRTGDLRFPAAPRQLRSQSLRQLCGIICQRQQLRSTAPRIALRGRRTREHCPAQNEPIPHPGLQQNERQPRRTWIERHAMRPLKADLALASALKHKRKHLIEEIERLRVGPAHDPRKMGRTLYEATHHSEFLKFLFVLL